MSVAEWTNAAGCNPAPVRVRRFESYSAHMKNRSECDCSCHRFPGTKHIVACCYYTSEQFLDYLENLGENEYGDCWCSVGDDGRGMEVHPGCPYHGIDYG